MKKVYWLRTLKALALLVPVIVFVFVSQYYVLFLSNHGIESMRQFYKEEPDSLDVVLIGASEVYAGFSPLYAYQEYGLTSYLYSYPTDPCSVYLHQIKEVIRTQHPQYIFVEMQGFLGEDLKDSTETDLINMIENIPLSRHKLELLSQVSPRKRLGVLMPFVKYHGQWSAPIEKIQENLDFRIVASRGRSMLKGESTETGTDGNFSNEDWYEDYSIVELAEPSRKNLENLLDYFDENEIDNIIFVRFPHKLVSDNQYRRFHKTNHAQQIIEERGYTMVDLEHDNGDVSFDVMYDFYDREHLNHYGRIKLTDYLCTLLTDEYGLEPREQTDENRAHWDKVALYAQAMDEAINERMDAGQDVELYESTTLLNELDARIRAWEEE